MIKKFSFIITLLLVTPFMVNAATWTNKTPTECGYVDSSGYHRQDCTYVSAWGFYGWENPVSPNMSGSTYPRPNYYLWSYVGSPFLGNDWTVRGQFFTTTQSGANWFEKSLPNMRIDTDYGAASCTISIHGTHGGSSNYFDFTCSGTSTNKFDLVLYFTGNFDIVSNPTYVMLRSDWSYITTDISNGSLAGTIDDSIKDSENNIISNQNSNQQQTNERLEETNENLNNINDSVNQTNDLIGSTDTPNASDTNTFLSDLNSYLPTNNVISDLVTMPITWISSLLGGFNSSCSDFVLGSVFGKNLVLPCITLSDKFGAVWSIIDVLFSGFMIFAISKKLVKIFSSFTDLDDKESMNDMFGGGN